MFRKISLLILFVLLSQNVNAQDEFITLWKPNQPSFPLTIDAPSITNSNQIWFPGIGENYTISWEEVNYPQHNGIMTYVTSIKQVLIDFGNPINPNPADATYKVKVSNGNGHFRQIRFATGASNPPGGPLLGTWTYNGSADKILEIQQWGNTQWISMHAAFAGCSSIQLTATDVPNLSGTTDASYMFHGDYNFYGSPSMANWNTSSIKNFKYMFGYTSGQIQLDVFNPPIGSWNTSSAEDLSYMFMGRRLFNQNLNSWKTLRVTDMSYMLANTTAYNQPMDTWDTSNVTDMSFMFHLNPNFNQPLNNWNISNVTDLSHMFHDCKAFNQSLSSWDTSKVTTISTMFTTASNFNQDLGSWNLPALTNGMMSITGSGLSCENYSKTISGWAINPNTASNINLGPLVTLFYASDVIDKRNILINKGWTLLGDAIGKCRLLGVAENNRENTPSIYPNPADNIIYIKNLKGARSYKIFDSVGRLVLQNILNEESITINSLLHGNYILQIMSDTGVQSLKFIKK